MHPLVPALLEVPTQERLAAPLRPRSDARHQALVLLKPECWLAPDPAPVLDLALTHLEAAGELAGAVVVAGPVLDRLGTLDRHYRLASQLSRGASGLITGEDRLRLAELCGLPPEAPLWGGHELLARTPGLGASDLDEAWYARKPRKLRSGTYAVPFETAEGPCLLVNGFFPAQLAHFTAPGRCTALLLLQSERSWAWLRRDMLGDTYPDRALPGSLRRTLLERKEALGLARVDITANFVHLSAGPLEGAWELLNFFGGLDCAAFRLEDSSVARRWTGAPADLEARLREGGDAFAKTEDLDLEEAQAFL